MQCQFCKEILEDVDALQLHQVSSCLAIEHSDRSIAFQPETVEVIFKWLIDRVIKVPSVFLIVSDVADNIELRKGVGCLKSEVVVMSPGRYSGQLVIDNDILKVSDFEVTILSEIVYLAIDSNLSAEGTSNIESVSDATKKDGVPCKHTVSPSLLKEELKDADADLSPLHKEMLAHQIESDYNLSDLDKELEDILHEDNEEINETSLQEELTLHQVRDLTPDLLQINQLVTDNEDDSFHSTSLPDTPPSTPGNISLYGNLGDHLSEISVKSHEEDGVASSLSTHLISHEVEGRQSKEGNNKSGRISALSETLLDSKVEMVEDVQFRNYGLIEVIDETKSEPYAAADDQRLTKKCTDLEEAVQSHAKENEEEDVIEEFNSYESEITSLSQQLANLTKSKEEDEANMLKLHSQCKSYEEEIKKLNDKYADFVQMINVENLTSMLKAYQENKAELEAKSEAYTTEVQRLTKEINELKELIVELQKENAEASQSLVDIDLKKDTIIVGLNEKLQYCECEMNKSKEEVLHLNTELEEHKKRNVQLEAESEKHDVQMKQLKLKYDEENIKRVDADNSKSLSLHESYRAEIQRLEKELKERTSVLENYKENKVQLESQCVSYDTEMKILKHKYAELEQSKEVHELCDPQLKELQEKCAELEKCTADQNDFIKQQMIIDLKVKTESCESEMERLNDEVERLKGTDEESMNMKSTLELKCQSYEEEIMNLKNEYGNPGRLGRTSDKLLDHRQLEKKYEELYESNQKLLQDYKGLEGANNLRQKEMVDERRRDQRLIKDLMEEKVKLLEHSMKNEKYDNSSESTALMKINKLKSENKLLREKLASIRSESEVNNPPASSDNTSPRYKPPMLTSYDNENEIRSGILKSYPQPSRHEHMNGEDYTLPSRYNVNRYSKSPETPPKSSSYEIRIDSILNRYSPQSPRANLDFSTRISRATSRLDSSLHLDQNGEEQKAIIVSSRPDSERFRTTSAQETLLTPRSRSQCRGRSLDRLRDASAVEEPPLRYVKKHSSLTTIPFCPNSIKELSVGMKISVNRTTGELSRGTVKWLGELPWHTGGYVGVELDTDDGKHNGILNGIQYFRCSEGSGIFVKFSKVIMAWKN